MATAIFAETKKLLSQMNGSASANLKISRKTLQLLERVPKGGSTVEEVNRNIPLNREAIRIAKDLQSAAADATLRLYNDPKQYGKGWKVLTEIDQFIRRREPTFDSIH